MYKIGIIGLGLMGGSLAKAFSKLEEVEKIVAYDKNEEALEKAKQDGTVQEIAHEIDKINLNELTPIDALNILAKMKEKMK